MCLRRMQLAPKNPNSLMRLFASRRREMGEIPKYLGPLDPSRMSKKAAQGYRIWGAQGARSSRAYSSREFVAWWLFHLASRAWVRPTCGRKNHAKGYFFENIQMEELADNIRERNFRRGNPSPRKKVQATWLRARKIFATMQEAEEFFGVNRKTIYNHCTGRTRSPWKYGPKSSVAVRFSWA